MDETRDSRGRFGAGNPGKPKGARTKLGEAFLEAMFKSFNEHGAETIERVRESDPSTYLKVTASLLPKEVTGKDGEPLIANITVVYKKPGE